ncbi:urea amidolyase [Microbulbifer sp. A4B17]|uniref:5-oxoprolinase subunit C family protein n=1 Tax=Microbulbifer sp. A4B17 TaxID=359370 RepID=UPI000D52C386|nr:biotin-dependent carboxyltransferase family protein [Microbulbifer sp. A4B17]AWF79837.1 urea amidolyase [Microbulbifer sp. A4B17]
MGIRFLRAGLQTSIQDLGRSGLMNFGIPWGGAADSLSMKIANLLLENPLGNPTFEISLLGPKIEFLCDLSIAIAGGQFSGSLNNDPIDNFRTYKIKSGDILDISQAASGARIYLAVSAQIDTPIILGSSATHIISKFGANNGKPITSGEVIQLKEIRIAKEAVLDKKFHINYSHNSHLRIVAGPERDSFPREFIEHFHQSIYQVSAQSNRMGIRLSPKSSTELRKIEPVKIQLLSSGLYPGSIQIPPDGNPIISFIEGQTIGGYPRIGHIIKSELHRLGQLSPNDRVSFQEISTEEAQKVLKKKQDLLINLQESLGRQQGEILSI